MELVEYFSQMSSIDLMAHIFTGAPLLYSLILAVFRHSVFEGMGIFDSIFDVMSFLVLMLITVRTRDMKETDKPVSLSLSLSLILW